MRSPDFVLAGADVRKRLLPVRQDADRRGPHWWLIMAGGGILGAAALLPVWLSSRLEVQLAFGFLSIGIVAMCAWAITTARALTSGRVRIAARPPLQFVTRSFCGPWGLIAALGINATGVVYLVAWFAPGLKPITSATGGALGSPFVFTAIGLVMLGYLLHRGIPVVGLRIDEHGLRTRVGFSALNLEWSEVATPVLVHRRKNVLLAVELHEGTSIVLYPVYFGSDPVIVAEVIEYYRTHPDERHLLADPLVALERVVDIVE